MKRGAPILIQKLKILSIAGLFLCLAACSAPREDALLSAVPTANSDPYTVYQGPKADYVLILKGQRRLILYRQSQPLKEYSIGIGWDPVGPKTVQGDGKTPEGIYYIDYHNPTSKYYKVSYPNTADKVRASSIGYSPGGGIMIHGIAAEHAYMGRYNRTEGCIAVTNQDIDELWNLIPDHTLVEIRA
jgi:murein L,D-transpeptidase YafK